MNSVHYYDKTVVSASDNKFTIWDCTTGQLVNSIAAHNRGVVHVNRKENVIFTGGYDTFLKLWDIRSGNLIASVNTIGYVTTSKVLRLFFIFLKDLILYVRYSKILFYMMIVVSYIVET